MQMHGYKNMEKEQATRSEVKITAGNLKRFADSVFNIVGNSPATLQVFVESNKILANVKNVDSTMAGTVEETVISVTGSDMEFGILNFQSLVSIARTFKSSEEIFIIAVDSPKGKGMVIGTKKSKFNFPFASEVACDLTTSPGKFNLEPVYTMDIDNNTLADLIRGSKVSKVGYDKAVFANDGTMNVINSGLGSNMLYTVDEDCGKPETILKRPVLIEHLKKCLGVLKAYGEGCQIHIYHTDKAIGLATPGMSILCAVMLESNYQ